MTPHHGSSVLALMVGFLLLVSGCSGAADSALGSAESAHETPQLATWPGPGDGPRFNSRVSGTITVRDGCVYFDWVDDELELPIFVSGTAEWDSEGLLYDGEVYREGDVLAAGGVFHAETPTSATIPAACTEHASFASIYD